MKVVIAAAMWQNPHMLVLDEPTNYLDRESLGALAAAIKDYGGGVVMISHSKGGCPLLLFFVIVSCMLFLQAPGVPCHRSNGLVLLFYLQALVSFVAPENVN